MEQYCSSTVSIKTQQGYNDYLQKQIDWDNSRRGYLDDGFNCLKCRDKGVIYGKSSLRGDLVTEAVCECECMNKRRIVRLLNNSKLNLRKYRLDGYHHSEKWQQSIYDGATSFLEGVFGSSFFIGGQSGCGKTFICSAICIELVKRQSRKIEYMLWKEDSTYLKQIINDPKEYQPELDRFQKVEVLYIDDFFKTGKNESPTTADVQLAFTILDYRYRNNMPTLISSEFTLGRINQIDAAIAGRIKEMCGDYTYSIKEDSKKNYRMRCNDAV